MAAQDTPHFSQDHGREREKRRIAAIRARGLTMALVEHVHVAAVRLQARRRARRMLYYVINAGDCVLVTADCACVTVKIASVRSASLVGLREMRCASTAL